MNARLDALAEPPAIETDPYSDAVLENPYPFHEAMRNAAPVVRLSQYDVYAVARHAEVTTVCSDSQRFSSAGGIGIQDIRKAGSFRVPSRLVEADPPDHTQVRRVVGRLISPRILRGWREMFIRQADLLVDGLLERGEFDGVEHASEAYVLTVFPRAVGIDMPRESILAIGEMRFNQTGPENERYHRAMARALPYLEWFEASCRRPAMIPGGLGDEVFQAEERGELPAGVASNVVRSLVGGGTDSTIAGIGATLHYLARNSDQFQAIKSAPRRIAAAFEEGVRLETPFQVVYRTTRDETSLSGYRIPPDRKVAMFLGAANRDPRYWQEPERFDVTRRTVGQVAFGSGIHVCIGQMIARMEAECLLSSLAARASSLELTGTPRYRLMNQLRTLDELPLRITG